MKINKIKISNYRQYKNLQMVFSSDKLYLLKGIMGTGKTNFLNAINWCFFEEEPYLKKDSKKLPLLNLNTMDEADDGDIKDVCVEIEIKSKNSTIIFTRTAQFRIIIQDGKKAVTPYKSAEFEVKDNMSGGGFDISYGEEAKSIVQRMIPYSIRDFFFFDGERLDRYFKEATAINIRKAIFDISETVMLKTIELHLNDVLSDFSRQAGRGDPDVEVVRRELESYSSRKEGISEQIINVNTQIKTSKNKILELNEFLRGKPKVKELQENRIKLQARKKEQLSEHQEKIEEHHNFLFESGKIVFLISAIDKAEQIISKKIENGELPPTKDKELLERILKTKICSICGTRIDNDTKKEEAVKNLLNDVKLSGEVAKILQAMEYPLRLYQEDYKDFKKNNQKKYKGVETSLKHISETDEDLENIARQLHGYEGDTEKIIRDKYAELEIQENLQDTNTESLGILNAQLRNNTIKFEEFNNKLEIALSKDKKNKDLKIYIDFIKESIQVLEETRKTVMNDLRKKITNITAKTFLHLMWRGSTFEKVDIDEGYNMKVHQFGYPVDPANVSGGERECLALSFTTALHAISGFDVPILIDRPLAMVSGPPRKDIAEMLLKLANNKQVILFLTQDDYDKNVSSVLNNDSCIIYEMKISENEKEVNIVKLES